MKKTIRPKRSLLTMSLLCTLMLTASSAAFAQDEPVAGGVLTVGLGSDTPVIDPSITAYSVTALVTRNVVDSLVGQAEDNSFTPWLAERWEIKNNNTEYTFHLRKDVTFSDGTKLDAAAVKYNFERILDPQTTSSYSKSLLGPIESITTPDEYTVVLHYKTPFAPLLQGLSLPYLGIQSPTYLQNTANTSNTVVGSGPYILDSFVKGSGSKLSRRKDYHWGPGYAAHTGPAWLDKIEFKYLPESAVRLGALNSGQVQVIDAIPPVNFAQVKKNSKLEVITRDNPGVPRVLYLNVTRAPFNDIRVDQALACEPDILICDEPVSALDVITQAQVLDLLVTLQRRLKLSMLFISHDLGVVQHMSHRIAVMKAGEIVETGSVEQIFNRPQHSYTRLLLLAMERISPENVA